jgi:2-methylcitrate dehydratase PrpD
LGQAPRWCASHVRNRPFLRFGSIKPKAESFSEKIAVWACQPNLDTDREARDVARLPDRHAGLHGRGGTGTANCHLWDAEQGFADLYGTEESIGFQDMMKTMTLGKAANLFPVARKLWPSCSYTHRAIWGAEQLHQDLCSDDKITGIRVRLPEPFHRVARFTVPQNDAEARFSVSYCTAVGLTTGHVTPDDFRTHRYLDPTRQRLTGMVELDLYDLTPGDPDDFGPSTAERITVTLKSGRALGIETTHVPGGVALPMTKQQLFRKVAECGCSVELAEAFLTADGNALLYETGLLDQEYRAVHQGAG